MPKNNDQPLYDIVIPVHKKDLQILEYCIAFAKKNLVGARRIIIVSKEKYTNNAEWFDETLYPFSIDFVRTYVGTSCGWYFQQLLKIYALIVIPDILENVLILDSDTVFFRKVRMFDDKGLPLYNISKDDMLSRRDFDINVAAHIEKLLPSLALKNLPEKFQTLSGVAHHMVFNKKIIMEMMQKIEDHNIDGDPFYKIFLKYSDKKHAASEYQLYYCFILVYHFNEVRFRKLCYKNTADIDIKKYSRRLKYHYCSFHHYLRATKRKSWRLKIVNFFTKKLGKFFLFEEWNIGIVNCPIADFLTMPNQQISWLKPKKFRADPFGFIDENGVRKVFYEGYNLLKKCGKIFSVSIDDGLKIKEEKQVLRSDFHNSYPYIFSHKNQKFVLVETCQTNCLSLYEIKSDGSLAKVKNLIENCSIVDPSIIFHDGKWWLFFTFNDKGNDNLYIAYSDDLFGHWKMHEKNPVKSNINSSRSAGEIFIHKGNIYRPAQNCSKSYGGSVTINKIIKLNTEEFNEIEEIEIFPNQLSCYSQGLHHIAKLGEKMTLLDGKRTVFLWYKPFLSLLRLLRKACL